MPLLEPLPEVKNLSQKVFERVREAILSGELAPGSRLVERRLAEDLEVSHIPVREALARLADEGLVDRNARRGSWVASLTVEELEEISSLRVVLEQFVAVRVQERWSIEAEEQLRAIVGAMQSAAALGDVEELRHQDRVFHETLWELAEHATLIELAARLQGPDQQRPARRHAGAQPGRARGACRKPRRAPRRDRLGRAAAGAPGDGGPHHHGDETCPANARRRAPLTAVPLVVVTDSNLPTGDVEERILTPAGFDVVRADCRSEDDVIEAGRDADALIVQWAPVSGRVLAELPRCRFVSRLGIGWDMIDVAAATERGIAVANTPDYCIEEVAAHAIALALAVSRGLLPLDASVRRSEWSVAANAPPVTRPSAAVLRGGRLRPDRRARRGRRGRDRLRRRRPRPARRRRGDRGRRPPIGRARRGPRRGSDRLAAHAAHAGDGPRDRCGRARAPRAGRLPRQHEPRRARRRGCAGRRARCG